MTINEPARNNNVSSSQNEKKYSASLRLWHWLNLIAISGSLFTVLINATILDRIPVTDLIKNELKNAGSIVTDKEAGAVVHGLGDRVWEIHTYFGYGLTALLLLRLILECFQLADQKFIRQIKGAYEMFKGKKEQRKAKHALAVKLIYGVFYILLLIMITTGLFLAFEDFFSHFKSIRHDVKEIHGFCMYLIITFIIVHIAGVFLAERTDRKGIVSDMINGGSNRVP